MPKRINIPGQGLVDFPDSWSYNDIIAAVKSGNLPEQTGPLQAQGAPGIVDRMVAKVPTGLLNNGVVEFGRRAGMGLSDRPTAVAQILANALPDSAGIGQAVNRRVAEAEGKYQAARGQDAGKPDAVRDFARNHDVAGFLLGEAGPVGEVANKVLDVVGQPIANGGENYSTDKWEQVQEAAKEALKEATDPLEKVRKFLDAIPVPSGNGGGTNISPAGPASSQTLPAAPTVSFAPAGTTGQSATPATIDDPGARRALLARSISNVGNNIRAQRAAQASAAHSDGATESISIASSPSTGGLNGAAAGESDDSPATAASTGEMGGDLPDFRNGMGMGDFAGRPLLYDPEQKQMLIRLLCAYNGGAI